MYINLFVSKFVSIVYVYSATLIKNRYSFFMKLQYLNK